MILPIPSATPEKQKAVDRLVDRILAAKSGTGIPACGGGVTDKNVCVTASERELDELVYTYYF